MGSYTAKMYFESKGYTWPTQVTRLSPFRAIYFFYDAILLWEFHLILFLASFHHSSTFI